MIKKIANTKIMTVSDNGVREHLFTEVLSKEQLVEFLPQVKNVFK